MTSRAKAAQLRASGLSYSQIAAQLHISKQRVHQLITGYSSPCTLRQKAFWFKRLRSLYQSKNVKLRFEILKRDGFACTYCGARPPNVELHVDHILPRVLGGQTTPENLTTACTACNLGKSDSLLPRPPIIAPRCRPDQGTLA